MFLIKFLAEDRARHRGGGGYLCSEMARGPAKAGCKIVVMDLRGHKAEDVARDIRDILAVRRLV